MKALLFRNTEFLPNSQLNRVFSNVSRFSFVTLNSH